MTRNVHNGETQGMKAVILAGGRGTRLYPYTAVLPKHLMPIGDKPILEIVISQLRAAGFTDLTFSVDTWPACWKRILVTEPHGE